MEHRHLDATNPSEKWFGKQGREKLPRLRTMHGYSPLNTTAEWFTRIPNIPQSDTKDPSETEESEARSFRSGQKHEITDRFIHHSQSAKKVYWLTTFLDDYQRYQENLKKPNDLPIEQLQAMRSDIQIFLVAESLISDQQLPEAAKKNIKAFLDPHLEEINAGIDRMKTLKSVKYFPFSDVALAYMDKLQENLAKFAEKLGQAGITNLDQLKENLKDLLKEIRRREIEHKKEIYDIITTISSKLDEVKKDRYFAFNANVLECERNLKAARSYKDQARGVTTEGLREQCQILRDDNESLDKLIETRIKEKVDQWSEQVGDVPCIQPGPGMFRNFEIASVLDTPAFVRLADNFHVALQPRKQPEDIYRALHSLQREPVAIDRLKSVYKNKYKKTLETALEERFGDSPQQNYALQLINQGNAETEQSIKPLSEYPSEDELYQVANRIYRALTRRYPSEVVYAALTPFERNTELLCSLNKCYYENHFEADLKSDILQGDPKAKDYALFLLGDQVLEKKVRSWSVAVRLQKAFLKLTFRRDDDDKPIPVPYDYLLQEGINWTHIMCQALKEAGYESKKIIALSLHTDEHGQKLPNLHVHTDLVLDMPDGQDPIVTWTYHIAPLIQVEASFGMVELVLDPSLSSEPLTIKQWMGKMGQKSFERISLDTYKTKLAEEYQKNSTNPYPADQTYVFAGSRNIPALPFSPDNINDLLRDKPIPDQDTSNYYQTMGKATMSNDAAWVPYIRMARSLREHMQSINDDLSTDHFLNTIATNFLKDVSTFHSISNTNFSSAFPNLYQSLRTHLANTHISAPIVERFEALLSGKHTLSRANGDPNSRDSVHDRGPDIGTIEYPDTDKAKDAEDQRGEVLQEEVDRWPLEEIHIERIQRPIFFRDCKIADVLDFRQLADDFNAALKPGKQPEDIYRVLQSLLREPEAINKLDDAYIRKTKSETLETALRETNGKTLETALNERFKKPEDSTRLEYALQLIKKGSPEAEQVIESLSAFPSKGELDQVAKRIHLTLTQPNPQPEVVYAVLAPFERNTELLCKLDARYNRKFKTGLKLHIENTLKVKDYALFLIGDQAMEKKEISYYEAMRLWKVVERLTFDRGDGVRFPVPYNHPFEGCEFRAHIICEVLKEMGYTSEKVFTSSYCRNEYDQELPNLHVRMDLAPDMASGEDPTITWNYHMAPCIQIKTAPDIKQRLVLDPSLHHRPLTVEAWMKDKLGQASFEHISLDAYQVKLTEEHQKNPRFFYPLGTCMLITSRTFLGQPLQPEAIGIWSKDQDIPDKYLSEEFKAEGRRKMINGAKWVPYNRMARSIRQELRNPTIQAVKDADTFLNKLATNFLADVSEYRSSTSSAFSNAFPHLYKELIEYVQTCIGHPSDSSSSERFREHLSGESRS